MADNKFPAPTKEELEEFEKEYTFEAPTREEAFEMGIPPKIESGEAFRKGVEEGATFGFAEEIGAGAGALGEIAGRPEITQTQTIQNLLERYTRLKERGAPPEQLAEIETGIQELQAAERPKPIAETYRKIREQLRGEYKAAEEQEPGAYLAGALTGGLAVPIPGAAVKTAAQIAKPLTLAQKAARGAAVGAGAGGLAGAGISEADLTKGEIAELGKEVAAGAALGAPLGAVIPATGAAIKSTVKGLTNWTPIQRVIKTFKRSAKGEKLSGELKNIEQDISKFGEKHTKDLKDIYGRIAETRKGKLLEAEKAGKIVDVEDDLINLRNEIGKLPVDTAEEIADQKKLLKLVDEKLEGAVRTRNVLRKVPVEGAEAKLAEKAALKEAEAAKLGIPGEIRKEIIPTEIPGLEAGIVTRETPKGLKRIAGAPIREGAPETKIISERIAEEIPAKTRLTPSEALELSQKLQRFEQFGKAPLSTKEAQILAQRGKKAVQERIGAEEVVPEFRQLTDELSDIMAQSEITFGKTPGETLQKGDVIKHLDKFGKMVKKFETKEDVQVAVDKMLGGFTHPETGQKIQGLRDLAPKVADEFEDQIVNLSEKYDLATAIDKSIENTSDVIRGLLGGAQALLLKGAEVVGKAPAVAREAREFAGRQLEKSFKMLSEKSPESIKGIAQQGMERFGEPFAKSARAMARAADAPQATRNAILFGLMQQPTFRNYMEKLEGLTEEKNERDVTEDRR
jgi:hypothetical protein